MRHLEKRDEEKMLTLLQKTNQSSAQKSHSKAEVLNDIYGERTGTYYEYDLAGSFDTDDFNAKLISLKQKWEAPIPGFYGWFDINRKILFIEETVIQSAREKLSSNQHERNCHSISKRESRYTGNLLSK